LIGAVATDRQRIDKWLWHARMVRTRADAAALVAAGFVRINGKRVIAPGQKVARGDAVTLALDRSVKVVQVADFCDRRGGAPAARALYRDLTMGSGAKAGTKAGAKTSAMPGVSMKGARPKWP
jgi:ribosome-associated heat shock protein Hsp15